MHDVEAKSILSAKNGMNLYRGCTHGCIYCDSRSRCYGMDHAFEDVAVKRNAPSLIEDALRRRRRRCMIGTGSMSDPYMPLERTERLTEQSLMLLEKYGFGATVITKSDLVLRDVDLLKQIHKNARCVVQMTLTTCDETLCRLVEPNVCTSARRAEVLAQLSQAGIPTVVWFCPILPFINDTEENVRGVLSYCFNAGVSAILTFGMGVTMRDGNREYFYQQLDRFFPGMKERYMRAFGTDYVCASPHEKRLMHIVESECSARGVLYRPNEVFAFLSAFPDEKCGEQLRLF